MVLDILMDMAAMGMVTVCHFMVLAVTILIVILEDVYIGKVNFLRGLGAIRFLFNCAFFLITAF